MIIERVDTFRTTIGGKQHSGWLPVGAAVPLPTPAREVELTFAIDFDGSGYLLLVESKDGSVYGDTWHESQSDAREQAKAYYGVPAESWRPVGNDDSAAG